MMSPLKVIKDLLKGVLAAIKASPYDKATYRDLFKLMYDLLRIARRDGLLMLERHVSDPHHSEIINKYPRSPTTITSLNSSATVSLRSSMEPRPNNCPVCCTPSSKSSRKSTTRR